MASAVNDGDIENGSDVDFAEEDDEDNMPLIEAAAIAKSNARVKPLHNCPSCSKTFTTNSLMLQHYSAVHEKKRFPCGYCLETFAYRSGRTRHIHSVHQKLRFRCTFCKLTYTSRETAQMHVKSKHKVKDNVDLYLDKLTGHEEKIENNGRIGNSDAISLKSQLFGNIRSVDQQPKFNNNTVNFDSSPKFNNSNQKLQHTSTVAVHQNGFAAGRKDSDATATTSSFASNLLTLTQAVSNNNNNNPSKGRLKCHHCEKTFAYNAGRSKHIRIVHMNVRYRCMLCHSSYTTRDYAVQHVSSAHCVDNQHPPVDYVERIQDSVTPPPPTQVQTASIVAPSGVNNDYYFPDQDGMDEDDELNQDDAVDDFDELDDQNSYYINSNSNNAESPSSSGQPLPDTSSNTASCGNALPFHCLQCGVGFETQERLLYHVGMEHEERKIYCDYCGKSLLRAASLVGHMRQSHPDISYRCMMCGATFACPADGAYHVETVHQSDPCEQLQHVLSSDI